MTIGGNLHPKTNNSNKSSSKDFFIFLLFGTQSRTLVRPPAIALPQTIHFVFAFSSNLVKHSAEMLAALLRRIIAQNYI